MIKDFQELIKEIDSLKEDKANLSKIISILSEQTSEDGLIDPKDEKYLSVWNIPGFHFGKKGMYSEAEHIFHAMYDKMVHEERKRKTRYHKGMSLHNLGVSQAAQGRYSEAIRNFALAYVEDILTRGKERAKEYPAYNVLVNVLEIDTEMLEQLGEIAEKLRAPGKIPPNPETILDGYLNTNLDATLIFQRKWERPIECPKCRGKLTEGLFLPKSFVAFSGEGVKAGKYDLRELIALFVNASRMVFVTRKELEEKMHNQPIDNIRNLKASELSALACRICGHIEIYKAPPKFAFPEGE